MSFCPKLRGQSGDNMDEILEKIPNKYINLWYRTDEQRVSILTLKGVVEVNNTVAMIWESINGENSILQIVEKISTLFCDEDFNRIQNDVCNTIKNLINLEVVTIEWNKY